MLRGIWRTIGLSACLALMAAGEASAQWGYGNYGGYGGYGWGGWGGGSTVQGSIARGLGVYAMGMGQYNLATAQANSINASTMGRWNEYMYEAQVHAAQVERARLARRLALSKGAFDAIQERITTQPSNDDVLNGDALNAALNQLSDPRIHSSALRSATAKVPGRLIRQIPFVNASEAVTICLDQLTNEKSWPPALRAPALSAEREAYAKAIDQGMEEDVSGDLTPKTIGEIRAALAMLRAKFEEKPPTDRATRTEAEAYLKALSGMTHLLDRPDVDKILAELDTIKETSLGSLLGFMQTFNLRFGRATTPEQRQAYQALYPLLDDQRDRMVASLRPEPGDTGNPPKAPAFQPTDFFGQMKLDHLDGPRKAADAKP